MMQFDKTGKRIRSTLIWVLTTASFLTLSLSLNAQVGTVSGVVKDAEGEPITGVNLIVKGAPGVGVSTNANGKFTIKLPVNSTLIASYIGCKTQNIFVGNKSFVTIVMQSDTNMEELQVIAYGTQQKVTVTGAITSIGTDELLKTPVSSLGNAMSGKMPGLSVIQFSGQPGGDDPAIYIRGVSSFKGNASPLVLVDGVERGFFNIDPNEVENITILKDASATAVFGVRGANGVILVTTRRGKTGKAKVSLSSSFGIQAPTRLVNMANSYQTASYYNEAQMNDGTLPEDVRYNETILKAFKDHSQPILYPDIDWMDYLIKKATTQSQHNINITGGSERVKYFISGGALSQDGILNTFERGYDFNFKYKRFNYRANVDFEVTKTTDLALSIGGRSEKRNSPISRHSQDEMFRYIYRATPFSGAGIVDGKWIVSNPDYIPGLTSTTYDGLQPYYGQGYKSAVTNVLDTDITLKQNLKAITKGLSFALKGAYNSEFIFTKSRSSLTPFHTPLLENGELVYRKSGPDAELGYKDETSSHRNWYGEARLAYDRKFGKHNATALVLYNQSRAYYPDTYTGTYPDIPTGYVGLVGRVTYDYATKYMIDFNIGYNGSENFIRERRYGVFPATSVGWIASQEKFMKRLRIISYLKFRASYGVVGNDKTGSKRFLYAPDTYALGAGYSFGTNSPSLQPGAMESALGNPFVTWEKAAKQNYGIDLNLFQDRLKINFDYFIENRTDILSTRNIIPSYFAMDLPSVNFGAVDNKGYEIAVKWMDNIGSSFRYWIDVNLAHVRNKIINMDEIPPNQPYMRQTGQPVWQNFGYKFWGFYDETADERYKAQFGKDIATHAGALKYGDCVYLDLDNNGAIGGDDVTAIGFTQIPEYTGGTTFGFSWKRLDFSMLWNYSWNVSRSLAENFKLPLGTTYNDALLKAKKICGFSWQTDGMIKI